MIRKSASSAYMLFFLVATACLFSQCYPNNQHADSSSHLEGKKFFEKQKGVHLFGRQDTNFFKVAKETNIEWITLVPWGFQEDYMSPEVGHSRGDSTQLKERNKRLVHRIQTLHEAGFKVFIKPHVWMDTTPEDTWRSDIFPSSEENWKTWRESYRDFILRYAAVAEKGGADMFCVGTEFTRLSLEKPNFWKELIKEVRSVYSGQLTYAANWYKEYENITFWEDLDYIGIQAYFPLTKNENPSLEEISKGWKSHLPELKNIHKKYGRKILFTEMGFKSTSTSAMRPWEWMDHEAIDEYTYSPETQARCYESFFDVIWKNDWFAGLHLWQMRSDHVVDPNKINYDFTPIGKPAQAVIAKAYADK